MKVIILNVLALIMTIVLLVIALIKPSDETGNSIDTVVYSDVLVSEDSSSDNSLLPSQDMLDYIKVEDIINSSEVSSKPPVSSEVSSKPPVSSEVSSKPPVSSEVSSKPPVSSEVSSKPPVSSEVSSKPPVSSEVSSKPPVSSEVSSKPPASSEVDTELINTIAGAVQREIVGVGTKPVPSQYEAYKAQAIASQTYMEYHKKNTGAYPSMPYTKPDKKTIELVEEVLGMLIYYNGSIINASYHAAAGGHTQSSEYIWGGRLPYLRGVPSKYDDYDSTYKIHQDDLSQKLSKSGINVYGEPNTWFELNNAVLTDGGYLNEINICGVAISGRKLREEILGTSNLKSPKIVSISQEGDYLIFATKGFGHGAGMSQLGARGYAEFEGWSYEQIITHYYTGVTIR